MNRWINNIITSWKSSAWLATALFAIATIAFAHAEFRHVVGTVTKLSHHVLTIKTAKGDVEVKLDDHTVLTKNGRNAEPSDLQPGARVVAEVPEGSKDSVAQSVKMGVVTKASASRPKQVAHK